MTALVDTDVARNIKRIQPLIGVGLIAAVALWFGYIFVDSMRTLTETIYTTKPAEVGGSIVISSEQPLRYGDTVSFRSTAHGLQSKNTSTFITAACFQDSTLVYQRTAQQGVSFVLLDQYEWDLAWDGSPASCSATLMYRVVEETAINVYILNSVSFEVLGNGG